MPLAIPGTNTMKGRAPGSLPLHHPRNSSTVPDKSPEILEHYVLSKRILAIASGGGHWQQLMLMRPAFDGHEVTYATTLAGLPDQFDAHPFFLVPDCNRNEPVAALRCVARLAWVILRLRPQIVISTGALPGVMAIALGKLTGARTIWVDSVANAESMSASGRQARRFADLWMSQWEHVATEAGAEYAGAVL